MSSPEQYAVAEKALRTDFIAMVGDLSLADIAVPAHFRNWEPIPYSEYRLWPVVPTPEYADEPTSAPLGEDNVIVHAQDVCLQPAISYLDSGRAIALGYRRYAVAAVGAGIASDNGAMRVAHIQGSKWVHGDPELMRGLRGGFWWAQSLVKGWMAIARQLDVPTIEIVPADQNAWWGEDAERDKRLIDKYDGTANALGFKPNDIGLWELKL